MHYQTGYALGEAHLNDLMPIRCSKLDTITSEPRPAKNELLQPEQQTQLGLTPNGRRPESGPSFGRTGRSGHDET